MSQLTQKAQPVPQTTGAEIFSMSEEARVEYMKSLGATNMEPPRVKSTHLKILANGRVLPWEELLAKQTELVVNCDASGNTDPAAWLPTVDTQDVDPHEKELLRLKAQNIALGISSQMTSTYQMPDAADASTPKPTEYPYGAIPLSDIENLNKMLET